MTEKELALFKDIKEDLIKLQHKIDNIVTSQSQTSETNELNANHCCKKCKRSNRYMNCMSNSCMIDLLRENNCPYFVESDDWFHNMLLE